MVRIAALALVAIALTAGAAPAQVFIVQSPPRVVYSPPPVVYYSSPVVTYSSPGPLVSYSYYAPPTVYSSPVPLVSYSYYPATTVYSAPAAYSVPGVVTTRSYVGLGIFRPRGVHTETYFSPR